MLFLTAFSPNPTLLHRAGRRWGSLWRAWWLLHWRAMAVRSALLFASDCASFATPVLLQALLSCLEAGDSPGVCAELR